MSKERVYLQDITRAKQLNLELSKGDGFVVVRLCSSKGIIQKEFKIKEEYVRITGRDKPSLYIDEEYDIDEVTPEEALEKLKIAEGKVLLTWDSYLYISGEAVNTLAILPYIDKHTRAVCKPSYLPDGEYTEVGTVAEVCSKLGIEPYVASTVLKDFLSKCVTEEKVYTMKLLRVLKTLNKTC